MKKYLVIALFLSMSFAYAGRMRVSNKSNGNIQIRLFQCTGIQEPILTRLEERDLDFASCCPTEVYIKALTGTAAPKAYTYRRETNSVQSYCSDFTFIVENTADGKGLAFRESVSAHYLIG